MRKIIAQVAIAVLTKLIIQLVNLLVDKVICYLQNRNKR